jgi:hypothetical protein
MSTLAILPQPRKRFCCPDVRVTTWALCIDAPFAKLIRGSWFAKVFGVSEHSIAQIRELLDSLYRVDSRRILATLIRLLGDFDLAEEAMHEAFAAALSAWPASGGRLLRFTTAWYKFRIHQSCS